MTEKQYKRANKMVYCVMLCVMLYMAVSLMFAQSGVSGSAKTKIVIQLVVVITGIIMATTGYILKRGQKAGAVLIVLGPTIGYFAMMCFNGTAITIMYALPIMMVSMVYLNARLMFVGDVVVIVGSIIQVVRLTSTGVMDISFAVVVEMTIILCTISSFLAARLLDRFNIENVSVIEAAAKDQIEKAEKIAVTAEKLIEHFNQADSVIGKVGECITANNFSMENIAQSTESTANAVQTQAVMCGEITVNTETAEKQMETMLKAAGETINNVSVGMDIIADLQEQSKIVREASGDTVKSTEELTRKIEEVKGIVGAILSISNQTNLLALNASIEAARAGEAGRGFAVVADEIRELSEQTKESVNKITDIITVLIDYASAASASVNSAISSVEKQNEMIETSHQSFITISEEVSGLSEIINNTENIMKVIFEKTTVISDNINYLSATSEEVSASSTAGLETSGEAVKNMNEFNILLNELYKIAEELKKTAGSN